METMIGFARISPTSTPWSPVTSAPNTNAPASAGTRPALLRMVTNMNADAAAVAPRAKDMMAPPIVMNVIPAAMQPITEAVLIKAVKLGIDRKPGVKIAQINNPPISIARAAAIGLRMILATCNRIVCPLRNTITQSSRCHAGWVGDIGEYGGHVDLTAFVTRYRPAAIHGDDTVGNADDLFQIR